jgi:N-acetylmuramic acid 6-phosphate etherase
MVERALRGLRRGAVARVLEREGAWGAVALARDLTPTQTSTTGTPQLKMVGRSGNPLGSQAARSTPTFPIPRATAPSPTEQRNPRSSGLDRMPLGDAVDLMLSEDARLPRALRAERAGIMRAVRLVEAAFRRGGRLIYAGAGTSGRLGVLDASECPPTFSVPPEQVQGIIAGGQTALWQSLEGAEDDAAAGARAVEFRGANALDVVVGIAASGRTPFVWGALGAARAAGARTALICFNPNLRFAPGTRPDVVLAPRIGPEVLTGSTRLKAGTATKLLLNMITTLAMVRLGKVVENLMVDVRPSNVKLRDRAVRIVQTLTGATSEAAAAALGQTGWVVKTAVRRLRKPRRA